VLTKTSSIGDSSILQSYSRTSGAGDGGLSVEDVMGMYEKGFADDSDDDDEYGEDDTRAFDDDRADGGAMYALGGSRPPTGYSDTGRMGARMLEAMNDPLPVPAAMGIPNPGRLVARDSAAMFRSSGLLPSSMPQDVGFGSAAERYESRRLRNNGGDRHDLSRAPTNGDLSNQRHDALPASNRIDKLQQPGQTSTSPLPTEQQTPSPPPQVPQEPVEDRNSRDRYGFRKATTNITRQEYDRWSTSYDEYLDRRRSKWVAFMRESSLMTENPNRFPPRSTKTKRFIRKGIPPDWRGAAWFYYAGGPGILAKHRGVYDDLVARTSLGPGEVADEDAELKQFVIDDIEKDLHRTFPDNAKFKPPRYAEDDYTPADEPPIISSLRRVLRAFALYNPRIGYCQSLNFLAGLLLLFLDNEEKAFWLLNVITRVYLPGTHDMSLEGSKVDLGVLIAALKDALPQVWKMIAAEEADTTAPSSAAKRTKSKRTKDVAGDPNRLPPITVCMTAWFMSCFVGTLPIETVLRVWDVFFYEGSRTLFRIALTIFKLGESEITGLSDPMEMFGVVQQLPRRMLDSNALMEACYKRRNGIGHLSQESVEEKRRERRDIIHKWKAEHETDANNRDHSAPGRLELDLAGHLTDGEGIEIRRKGTLFGRRKERRGRG
jgi:hypothetical protein